MSITFEIRSGSSSGQRFWLRLNQTLSVGRSREADYQLDGDPRLSSIHFRVGLDGAGGWIEDLGSTNGTTVNGRAIAGRSRLQNLDEIAAGDTVLVVLDDRTKVRDTGQATEVPSDQGGSNHPVRDEPLSGARSQVPAASATQLDTPRPAVTPSSTARPGNVGASEKAATEVASVPLPEAVNARPRREERLSDSLPVPLQLAMPEIGRAAVLPWTNARGEGRLTVIYKVTWQVGETGATQPAEQQLPIWTEDQHEEDDPQSPVRIETDLVPFKPRADIVVVGQVHAPGGRPVTQLDCELRVGSCRRRLRVWGDRRWSFPTMVQLVPRIVGPEPFSHMPLSFARAFGGFDSVGGTYCEQNLAGVGFLTTLNPQSVHNCRLPNFEDPDQLITQFDSHPRPAGLGFWGRGWMPRLKHALVMSDGGIPAYEFFNGAPGEQQYDGYLSGTEPVGLVHLARRPQVEFQLPGYRPAISVVRARQDAAGGVHLLRSSAETRVAPRLDTLVLFPEQDQFVLVYRAVFDLPSLENPDIHQIEILPR
jgi:pSer/pThr/pTyr-binding forkhead associated (FHA) protein